MKKGYFIQLEYVGRVKATNEIFDLTLADLAKKEGIYDPKQKYEPSLVVIGEGMIINGVEKQLIKMKINEEKKFEVKPAEAFGFRNPKFIKIISLSKFLHERINPVPGLWVNIDGKNCRIQSVSGGRVRVDFNHPLAGKELLYWVKIKKQIKKPLEKIQALIKYYNLQIEVKIVKNTVTLTSKKPINPVVEKGLEKIILKWIPQIKSVKFKVK